MSELKFSQAKQARPVKPLVTVKETAAYKDNSVDGAIQEILSQEAWVRAPLGHLYKKTIDGIWVKSGGLTELQGVIMSRLSIKSALANEAAMKLAADRLPEVSIVATVPHKHSGLIRLNGISILNLRAPLPEWEQPTDELRPLLSYLQDAMGEGYEYFMAAMHRYAHQIDDDSLLPSQAIVLVGDYGAGKTLITRELLCAILGAPSDMNENALASQFTGSLFASPYVVADDALTGHKLKPTHVAAKLKEITGLCEQRVEQKGKDAVQLPWSGPLIITANLGETSALPDWRAPAGEAPRLVAVYMRKPEGGPERMAGTGGKLIEYIRKVRAQFAQYVYNWKVPAEISHERYVTKGYVAKEIAMEFDERPDPARKIIAELQHGCLMNIVNMSSGDIFDILKARDLSNRDKPPVCDKYLTERKLGELLSKLSLDDKSTLIKSRTAAGYRYTNNLKQERQQEVF